MKPLRHVLVVDDVHDNLNLLAQFLEEDYRVSIASNGLEAIACIKRDRPDVVLLDLMMPVLDGFGVLEYMNQHPGPFLPMIIVTAATEREERLKALRAGAHEFLNKPVDEEELFARIATLLALKEAREETEREARLKSLFLATMSHEIRSPLTAIIGFAQLLGEPGQTPASLDEARHIIASNGEHLLGVVNNILEVSKLEAGGFEVGRVPVDLLAFLREVELDMSVQARQKTGLAFTMETVLPLPRTLVTDPVRLRQILLNLYSNAIKFTQKGEVRFRVRFEPALGQLQLSICDTGIGMAPEHLARLFQPYAQADSSTAGRFGGTGLGLYIARSLAGLLDGSLEAHSEVGAGSEFALRLATGPVEVAELVHEYVRTPTAPLTREVPLAIPQLQGTRVLVVEDVEANQRLIAHYIEQTGATYDVASNGREALELALSRDFDLVLMDMQMPVLGGLAATVLLRQAGFYPPIVALTADVLFEDVQRYLRAGCNACLAKPIDRRGFYAELSRHLDGLEPTRAEASFRPTLTTVKAAFVENLNETSDGLREAAKQHDWAELQFLAHSLCGTAGLLGFQGLSDAAELIETALRSERGGGAGGFFMQQAFASFERALPLCEEPVPSERHVS